MKSSVGLGCFVVVVVVVVVCLFLQTLQVIIPDEHPHLGSIALEQWFLNWNELHNDLESLLKDCWVPLLWG